MNKALNTFFKPIKMTLLLLGLFLINGQLAAQQAPLVEVFKEDFDHHGFTGN